MGGVLAKRFLRENFRRYLALSLVIEGLLLRLVDRLGRKEGGHA